jgi:hypothetical protein
MGLQQDIDNHQEQMNKIVAERLADLKSDNDTNYFIKKILEGDRFTLDVISKHLGAWGRFIENYNKTVDVINKNAENYNKHVNGVSNRIQILEKKAKYNHRMIGLILVIQLFLFIFDITINF